MSLAILQKVKAHIEVAGLLTGFSPKYFRWTDADVKGTTPFMLFRRIGGNSNMLLQGIDVLIQQVGIPTGVVDGDSNMGHIIKLFRGSSVQPGIIRFDPMGEVMGPLYLENGRPVWELTIRCYAEDQ